MYLILSLFGRYVPSPIRIYRMEYYETVWTCRYMTFGNKAEEINFNYPLFIVYLPLLIFDNLIWHNEHRVKMSEIYNQEYWQ
jgi:hypothetical protein